MAYLFLLSIGVTLLAITSLLMWYYWVHRKTIAVARRLPTVYPTIPLLGHSYFIMMGERGLTNFAFRKLKALASLGMDAMVFWLGPIPFFMIFKPEDIQVVVNNCLSIGPEGDILKIFIGDSLLAAPAHIWRVTRRYYQPLYHPHNLELLMPGLNRCGRDLTFGLSRYVGCGSVDLTDDLESTSFKAACYLIFGPDFEITQRSSDMLKFFRSLNRVDEITIERVLRVWLWPDFLVRMFFSKDIKDFETTLEDFISSACKVDSEDLGGRSVKEPLKTKQRGEERACGKQDYLPYTKLQDAFETLRKAHPEFTFKNFKEEIASTLIAGSETTRLSTSYCLLALAAHPDIQEAVYKEILTVAGADDGDVTAEHLKAMTYLDRVVKETLRKFLILPVLRRKIDREIKLSFGTLPAGAKVVIVIPAVHYNPKFYPDPERFDPDRFTPENVAKRPKGSFIPFLTGPRNCIGQHFAMMEMKTILVHLIRKYKFTTSVDIDNIEYKPGISFKPACLNPVNFEFRQ